MNTFYLQLILANLSQPCYEHLIVKKTKILEEINQHFSLLDCTSWQHKEQLLNLYRANQHDLPLETVIMREPVVSESWNERTSS